jgi:hypothetical protein
MWLPMSIDSDVGQSPRSLSRSMQTREGTQLAPDQTPTAADLDTWNWDQYLLETDVAAELGLGFGGTAQGNRRSRVLVAEFSRSKTVSEGPQQSRYGVAARLIVNVVGYDADANLTLPFVAAEAQFNRLEASAGLRVEGYVGTDTGELFPNFGAFDVESYVKLMDALNGMRVKIGSDEANIRPAKLWVWTTTGAKEESASMLGRGVATAWALTRIKEGDLFERALTAYRDKDDQMAQATIEDTYAEVLGPDFRDFAPDEDARNRARQLLDGYELHVPWFGIGA